MPTLLLLADRAWGLTIKSARQRRQLAIKATNTMCKTPGTAVIVVEPIGSKFEVHGLGDPRSQHLNDVIRVFYMNVEDTSNIWSHIDL